MARAEKCEISFAQENYCAPTFHLIDDKTGQPADCSFDQCGCIDLIIDPDTCEFDTTGQIESHALITLASNASPTPADDVDDACITSQVDQTCGVVKHGWWWDAFREHKLGSRLWTLEFAEPNNDARLRAHQIIKEDFQYLVDAGAIDRVEVDSVIDACTGRLCIKHIDIYPPKKGAARRIEIDCMWGAR